MLDRVDPGLDGALHPERALGVRRHAPAEAVGLVHDGPDLSRRVVGVVRAVELAADAAGGADLHQIGVQAADLAYRPPDGVDAVGEDRVVDALHPGERERVEVAVAAGLGDDRAGGQNARARHRTLEHRLAQAQGDGPADVAHRRVAGVQEACHILDGARAALVGRDRLVAVEARARQVDVAIDQAGQQRRIRPEVDATATVALGGAEVARRADRRDPAVLHRHRAVADDAAAVAGKHPAGGIQDPCRRRAHRSPPLRLVSAAVAAVSARVARWSSNHWRMPRRRCTRCQGRPVRLMPWNSPG